MSNDDEKSRKKSYHNDAEEIREVFGALNEAIPKLISGLIGSVYSPDAAASVATAIGRFYSKLIEEGIPPEVALEMTKNYVSGLDFAKFINMVSDESRSSRKVKIDIDEFEDDDE